MLIGKPPDIPSSAITSKDQYLNRRRFLRGAVSGAVATGAAALGADRLADVLSPRIGALAGTKLDTVKSPLTTTGEQSTSYDDVTHYNNFYEFGVNKDEPAKNAGILPTRPWTIRVDGKVKAPKTFDIDTLLKLRPLEDRVYRHRCVEAWSMVDSLGGLLAFGVHQALRSALNGEVRAVPLLLRQARGEMVVGPGYLLALLRGTAHG